MKLHGSPEVTRWADVPPSEQTGASGASTSRTRQFADVQVRLVSYGANYVADHWCHKGHILFVVDGWLALEHQDGQRFELQAGMSYHVGDDQAAPHRVITGSGATVFIVD
jgi:hypothetical protein